MRFTVVGVGAPSPGPHMVVMPPGRRPAELSSAGAARSSIGPVAARGDRGRGDGHDAAGVRPGPGRLRPARGLQRGAQRHPARCGPGHPRRLLRGRRGRRRDQHLRRQPGGAGRVRHLRGDLRRSPPPRPGSPGTPPTPTRRPTVRGSCWAASVRAPSCRPWATSASPLCATPTRPRSKGMLTGGIDAVLIETSQDLLQTRAATLGAKRALAHAGRDLPVIVHVTVETTGTMLLGTEIGAALTALEPLGIDLIGLNCATGPAEMSEHLRHLSRYASIGVSCMPNAGLPQLTADGAHYPLKPVELADALEQFVGEFGLGLVGGCCGTGPEHLRRVVERLEDRAPVPRTPTHVPAASLAVRGGAVPAGHQLPLHRGADQRQRLEGLPRGAAGGALGRLRRHRPGPDPRRRPPARPQHRLRRPGRRGRHAGDRLALRHRVDPAARARLDRAGRAAGRPGVPGRPGGDQLGQLRGRRRPGLAVRPDHAAGRRARCGGDRADHRRGGPGPYRGVEGRGSPTG